MFEKPWNWLRGLARRVDQQLGHEEVWVLVLAVATPLLAGGIAWVRSDGWDFDGAVGWALVGVATVVAIADAAFLVGYLSGVRPFWGALFGALVAAEVLWRCWSGWVPDHPIDWALLVLLLLGVAALILRVWASPTTIDKAELIRGAFTLTVALTATAAIVVVILQAWPTTAWVRFAGVSALALAALFLIAPEWSRVAVLLSSVVLIAGSAAVLIQIGYQDLRDERYEPVTRAEEALARLEAEATTIDASRDSKAEAAVAALSRALTAPDSTAPVEGVTALTGVRDALRSAQEAAESSPTDLDDARADVTIARQALAAIERLPDGPEVTRWREQTYDLATAAIAATVAALDYPPASGDVSAALEAARLAAPGSAQDEQLTSLIAALELELAAYRAAVTGSEEDEAALTELQARQGEPEGPPITFLDALTRGPEVVFTSISGESVAPLVPGPVGWAIFGVLTLALWIWLLRINARQLAGPVRIENLTGAVMATTSADAAGAATDPPDTTLDTVMRIAVLQNLKEPGAAPGSDTLAPVTELLDVAGAGDNPIGKAVKFVAGVVGQSYGYIVAAEVAPASAPLFTERTPVATGADPTAAATTEVVILVRVKDLRSGSTLVTKVIRHDDPQRAVRMAGLWASGYVLSRSTRVPSWASWQGDTAGALDVALDDDPTLTELENAVRHAPTSGVLLQMLSNSYALNGRLVDALEPVARAVVAHPRYGVAQYRLAATLAMVSHHCPEAWSSLTPDRRVAVSDLLLQVVSLRDLSSDIGAAAKELGRAWLPAEEAENHLATVSEALARALEEDTCNLPFLAATLRRSERDTLLTFLRPMDPGSRHRGLQRGLTRSLRLIYAEMDDEERTAFLKSDGRSEAFWQIVYNTACAHAVEGQRIAEGAGQEADPEKRCHGLVEAKRQQEAAMALLESCLTKPGVDQLSARWLTTDPDLVDLNGWPRFQRLASQLRQGD